MNPEGNDKIQWEQFPPTIAHLAAGFGIRPESMWAYAGAALGGLAGPNAKMFGFFGEAHQPAIPLILGVRDPSVARHLDQLALEPAVEFNNWQRNQAMAFFPEWFKSDLKTLSHGIRQKASGLIEQLRHPCGRADEIADAQKDLLRWRRQFQPSVMLSAPSPDTFDKVRGSVLDECPLIRDPGGSLIRNCLFPGPRLKDWRALLARILEGARGGVDQPVGEREHGFGTLDSARMTRTPFVTHLPSELIGKCLFEPSTANALEVAALIPTAKVEGRLKPAKVPEARRLLNNYREAIREVLWARYDSSGISFSLNGHFPELENGSAAIDDDLDNLPSEVRRYCGGLYGLPLRLLWTALVLDDPKGSKIRTITPALLQTAQWCVDRQVDLIREALEEENRRQLRQAALVMFEKLRGLPRPCKMGDLMRRYNRQRQDEKIPTLIYLKEEGVVDWNPEANEIRLLDTTELPSWLQESEKPLGIES